VVITLELVRIEEFICSSHGFPGRPLQCHSQGICGENDFFIVLSYFFARSIIAEMKETRRPNNTSANTFSSSVTTKYMERIKENTRDPIMLNFFISEHPFW
jgi:hypothetical protein